MYNGPVHMHRWVYIASCLRLSEYKLTYPVFVDSLSKMFGLLE